MTRVVNEAGIPAIESEIGGLGIVSPEGTQRSKASVRALMAHLGMAEGDAVPWRGRIVEQFEIASPCGGFLEVPPLLGAELREGDTLGLVRALDGSVLERITMTRPGLLGAVRRAARIQPGERIARLFTDCHGPEAA